MADYEMDLPHRLRTTEWLSQLPLILTVVSLFLLVAFQAFQLVHERAGLSQVHSSQEPTVQEGVKLRQKLEALAGRTAQLATDGDAGAREVVDQMRREGINLSPPKQ